MSDNAHLPWLQPAWLQTAHTWISDSLAARDIELTGSIEQQHLRPWSTVCAVPTNAGTFYFKATLPSLAYEAALTPLLAKWYPDRVPAVLASRPDLGWLLLADGGTPLRQRVKADGHVGRWVQLLPHYAAIQADTAGKIDQMLAAGTPDRRLANLPAKLQTLLADTAVLRIDQEQGISTAEYQRLLDFVPELEVLCRQLDAFGLPQTLEHGDFHDNNIFMDNGRALFFDWGDSGISHPFFSLRTSLVSLENSLDMMEESAGAEQLRQSYLSAWSDYGSVAELTQAYQLARPLAPVIAALRWNRVLTNVDQRDRTTYQHAVPSLLQELLELNGAAAG